MVKYYPTLDDTFSALSHPIRREILARLARGQAAVTELAEPFTISLPAILKHVHILEQVGLLTSKKVGRIHTCQLNPIPMQQAAQWLSFYENFWDKKLDGLGEFLKESNESDNS